MEYEKKSMTQDKANLWERDILKGSALLKIILELTGHYTYNNENVKNEIKNMFENLFAIGIDRKKYVLSKVKECIQNEIECFNLEGLTSKVKNYMSTYNNVPT